MSLNLNPAFLYLTFLSFILENFDFSVDNEIFNKIDNLLLTFIHEDLKV